MRDLGPVPGLVRPRVPARLTKIRREQAKKRATAEQRAAERARLDTGPPDWWVNEPPDDVVAAWVEEWILEAEVLEHESARYEAQFDDALATMLDEERTRTT